MRGNKKERKNEMVIDRYTGRKRERNASEIDETLSKK